MKKLLFFWNELKASFWFIPVVLILLAIIMAVGLVYLDSLVSIDQNGVLRYFFVQNLDSARNILTTISSAMIGVAGTVFSVTLVVLTLAASQFGPRLIKNFMDIRLNQVVLGAYISTFLFCLLVLSSIKDQEDYLFLPSISILVAVFAAVANIILIVFFIHNIAISIQADKVVSDISDFIAKQVETLFPEKMGDDPEEDPELDLDQTIRQYPKTFSLPSPNSGYLQYLDSESLMKTMEEKNLMMILNYRPGSYLVSGIELAKIYGHQEIDPNEIDHVLDCFIIGKTKTAQQDLEHSIHQMVEIAVRALSPGVNDPYTAISCIDNLSSTMCYLTQARLPSKYRYDTNQTLRIISDHLEFKGMMNAAFNQIRQFAGGSPAVLIRLIEAFINIDEIAKKKSHKKEILKHAEMVLRLGRDTIKEKHDLDDLENQAKELVNLAKE